MSFNFTENFNDDVRVEAHTLQTLREEAFVLKMGEIDVGKRGERV